MTSFKILVINTITYSKYSQSIDNHPPRPTMWMQNTLFGKTQFMDSLILERKESK